MNPQIEQIQQWCRRYPDRVFIKSHTYGNPTIVCYEGYKDKLIMGDYCSIADSSTILLSGDHQTKWLTTYPFPVFSE